MQDGHGRRTFSDGTVREGEFVKGLPHGKVRDVQVDGTLLELEFINGKLQPALTKTLPDGTVVIGTMDVKTGEHLPTLVCNFVGPIRVITPDKRIQESILVSGYHHGPAKITLPDGTVCEGLVKCDQQYGKWKITRPDGSVSIEDQTSNLLDQLKLLVLEQCLVRWPEILDEVKKGKKD